MASLCPQLPILQTHNIERLPGSIIALFGNDLDPRIGCDSRIEPVEETTNLDLHTGRTLKKHASYRSTMMSWPGQLQTYST